MNETISPTTPIERLGFSTRTQYRLHTAGISTLSDFIDREEQITRDAPTSLLKYPAERITLSKHFEGYELSDHDQYETHITELDLSEVSFRQFPQHTSIAEVINVLKEESGTILLGLSFANAILSSESAKKWLERNSRHRIYCVGTAYHARRAKDLAYPFLSFPPHGKNKEWDLRLDERCNVRIMPRLTFPTISAHKVKMS